MYKNTRSVLFALSLPFAFSACGSRRSLDSISSHTTGYAIESAYIWSSGTLRTCWENGTNSTATWRETLRQTVEAAYAPVPSIKFTGWTACTDAPAELRIEIYKDGQTNYRRQHTLYDGHPRAAGIGNVVNNQRPGVILNPTLTDVQPSLIEMAKNFNSSQIANLQASIVVHELGHVLGLLHEQERPDSPCTDYGDSNVGGGIEYGNYDPQSIMNYCVTHQSDYKKALSLSTGDIKTLSTMYPKK